MWHLHVIYAHPPLFFKPLVGHLQCSNEYYTYQEMTHKNIWEYSVYMQMKVYFDLQFVEVTDVCPWICGSDYPWKEIQEKRWSTRTPSMGWVGCKWNTFVLGKHLYALGSLRCLSVAWISGNTSFGLYISWHYPFNLNEYSQSNMDKLTRIVSPSPGCQWQNWAAKNSDTEGG